jgi:23S rRNA pseudouridine1911/1915/1917 synthase
MRSAPRHSAGIVSLAVNRPDPKPLQDFLAAKFSLSRRTAKAMIDGRSVWVNRKCVWIARYELKTGDVVEIPDAVVKGAQKQSRASAPAPETQTRQKRHVRVLWQDDCYLICDKPAGMVSCDDPKSVETVLREQEKIPTLEAVHRLDRDTTGCLMFAKNHASLMAAVEIFKTHKVSKTYHAIVAGKFPYAHQIIDEPIDKQSALTKVNREAYAQEASFLRVRIETGRTNQIRRHLASVRFPIVGDRVFGLKSARDARLMRVPRQMLHASTLSMPHPVEKRVEIKAHSPLPADFRGALKLFGMGK